jgi:hypothetical protein
MSQDVKGFVLKIRREVCICLANATHLFALASLVARWSSMAAAGGHPNDKKDFNHFEW